MNTCLYASDLNDAEWALLEPLVPRNHPAGRRQTYPLRRIIDAIFYLLRTGAQWRMLPHEYPSRSAASITMLSGARTARGSRSRASCARVIAARLAGLLNRARRSSTVNRSRRLRWEGRAAMTAPRR